jgi:hypothetical protein
MHQTTIRFGHELWDSLEAAAEQGGVSVAQYVREAAIERLVRGGTPGGRVTARRLAKAELSAAGALESSAALAAQSRLAATRAREVRARAKAARET